MLNDAVAGFYRAIRKYWTTTDARMGIVDFTSFAEFALSGDLIVQLAQQEEICDDRSAGTLTPTEFDFVKYQPSRLVRFNRVCAVLESLNMTSLVTDIDDNWVRSRPLVVSCLRVVLGGELFGRASESLGRSLFNVSRCFAT